MRRHSAHHRTSRFAGTPRRNGIVGGRAERPRADSRGRVAREGSARGDIPRLSSRRVRHCSGTGGRRANALRRAAYVDRLAASDRRCVRATLGAGDGGPPQEIKVLVDPRLYAALGKPGKELDRIRSERSLAYVPGEEGTCVERLFDPPCVDRQLYRSGVSRIQRRARSPTSSANRRRNCSPSASRSIAAVRGNSNTDYSALRVGLVKVCREDADARVW